jgi:KUP system potassium uptake protein
VIAAQAVITGAFSVAAQAAQLGYLPRLRIAHTSASTIGQIYVPSINWLLMLSVLTLVFAFRSSAALAYAYGMAVIATITITTTLFLYLARLRWRTPWWLLGLGGGVLLAIDLLFLAATLTKIAHGAWLPLLIAVSAFAVMTTWQRGRQVVTRERERAEGPLGAFIDRLRADRRTLARVRGTAVFLNRGKQTAPLALRANVEHNHVLHERILIVSIETLPVPHVPDANRIQVDDLGYAADGMIYVSARFGYMDTPDIPGALRLLEPEQTAFRPAGPERAALSSAGAEQAALSPVGAERAALSPVGPERAALRLVEPGRAERPIALDDASYFLSKIELTRGPAPTLAPWRKRLFIATSYLTADAAEFLGLPRDRTVIMGSRIDV